MMRGTEVQQRLLSYTRFLDRRNPQQVDLVVIHCTELPDLQGARNFGEKIHYSGSGTGNSGHFYIDRDGSIQQWVPYERIAHHVPGYNERSIGIELVNLGRYPRWFHSDAQQMKEPYDPQQLSALIDLLGSLCGFYPDLRWICGHSDLDQKQVPATDRPEMQVRRKLDPGPLFPWNELMQASCLSGRLRRYLD